MVDDLCFSGDVIFDMCIVIGMFDVQLFNNVCIDG